MIISRIIDLLDSKQLKVADLCRVLGINTSTMTNWKNRGTDPPAKFIAPICEFLGVSYEFLLTGEEKSHFSDEDKECLDLFHQLSLKKRYELIGYMKRMVEEETVAAEPPRKQAK